MRCSGLTLSLLHARKSHDGKPGDRMIVCDPYQTSSTKMYMSWP